MRRWRNGIGSDIEKLERLASSGDDLAKWELARRANIERLKREALEEDTGIPSPEIVRGVVVRRVREPGSPAHSGSAGL